VPATPQLADLLQDAAAQSQFELHTAMPGQVVSIYADAQTKRQFADVQPCLRRALATDDDALEPLAEESLPVLPRVPIAYMQGGGWFVSLPLKVGDFVLLIFAERSIDRWLAVAKKNSQATIATGDIGPHTLDGAIALPVGPAPIGELLDGVSATDLVIGKSGGGMLISIGDSLLQLGATSGTDFVALAGLVKSAVDDALSKIWTHTHIVNTTGTAAAQTGTALAQTGPAPTSASVAATKVKAI
jgi:hypothetical protein